MRSRRLATVCLAALFPTLSALAAGPLGTATAAEVKTGKERLSDKASDDQRVDNCGVPLDRRGSVPRPDCAAEAAAAMPATRQDGTIEPPSPEQGE